jgi:hypothetical protein
MTRVKVDTNPVDVRYRVKFRRDTAVDTEEFAVQQGGDG